MSCKLVFYFDIPINDFATNLSSPSPPARRVVTAPSWRWDAGRSARHNQDIQRDRESHVMKELTAWLSLARAPDSASVKPQSSSGTSGTVDTSRGYGNKHDAKQRKEPPAMSPGIYYKLEAEFRQRHVSHNPSSHGAFRAKVQAISRIKMRLRNRAAFSANR